MAGMSNKRLQRELNKVSTTQQSLINAVADTHTAVDPEWPGARHHPRLGP